MIISGIVLLNCCLPFDARIIDEENKLSAVSHVYRTSGIYDLIVKVSSDTENGFGGSCALILARSTTSILRSRWS